MSISPDKSITIGRRSGRCCGPYLGTQFQIAGRQSRQFSIRGPLAAAVAPAGANDSLAWLRPLVIEAGSGWSSARYGSIQFAAAQFDAQLADGTLTLVKPLTLGLSEGQLVLSPRLRLSPGPVQLTLDKGPLVRQVRLSQEMCSQWLKYVSPLVDKAARRKGSSRSISQVAAFPLTTRRSATSPGSSRSSRPTSIPARSFAPSRYWIGSSRRS